MPEEIIVIGGGAAGMMAAYAAAECGRGVLLLERNEKLGKKLFITGKGRCNVTNACEAQDFFQHIPGNAKFLYSAFYTYDNFRVMDFFEQNGIKLVTERGMRVFPASGHSSDIIRGLANALKKSGVKIKLDTRIRAVRKNPDGGFDIQDLKGRTYHSRKVILATGGMSYPATGSTGDGYEFAKSFGHQVEKQMPGLVAMNAAESYVRRMQGLSLKNVRARIYDGDKLLYDDFGEMLFTHFGVSGPLMLRASSMVGELLQDKTLKLVIDLKPALSKEQLDKRILRDFEENHNKQFKNALNRLLPSKLIPVSVVLSKIPPEKQVHEITKNERMQFLEILKCFPVTLTGIRDFDEAIITRGGVAVKEINPSTMESKFIPGLYFAGELMDADALTGGFNLQIAWSTGYLAGFSAAND